MPLKSNLNVHLRQLAVAGLLTLISLVTLQQSAFSEQKNAGQPESFPVLINNSESSTLFPNLSWKEGKNEESISDSKYRFIAVPKDVVGPLANAIFENFPGLQDKLDIQTTVRGVVFNADMEVAEDFDKELRELVSAVKEDVKKHSDVQLYIRLPLGFRNSNIKELEGHQHLPDNVVSKEPVFNELYSMRGSASLVHRLKKEIRELLAGKDKQEELKHQKSEPGNDGNFLQAIEHGIKEPVFVNSPKHEYEKLLSQIRNTQAVYLEQSEEDQAGEDSHRIADELEQLSHNLWEAEQQLLKNQVIEMKRRLAAIEEKLERRDKQRAAIVKRRIEALKKRKPSPIDLPPFQDQPFPYAPPLRPTTPQRKPVAPQDPFAYRNPSTIRPADVSKPRNNDPFAEDIYESEWKQPEPPAETDATRAVETLLNANSGELVITPRQQSVHNLTKLNQALLNYHAANGHFPPASKSLLKQGIPLNAGNSKPTPRFSWRVELLPWLGEQDLYNQYRTDEPWDSEHNKKLLAKMPDVYRSALDPSDSQHSAYYVVVSESTKQVGNPEYITLFGNPAGAKYKDVHDGTTNTIAMVELDLDIPWTKPDDLKYDPAYALPNLPTFEETGFHAGFVDGAVRFIPKETPIDQLRHFFEMNDGMPTKLPPIVNSFGTVLLKPIKTPVTIPQKKQISPALAQPALTTTFPETSQLEKEILQLEVAAAEQKLMAAQSALNTIKKMIEKGYTSSDELSKKELAVSEAAIELKRAELALQRGTVELQSPRLEGASETPKSREMLLLDLELAIQVDKLAKDELVRVEKLYKNGAISQSQLAEAKSKAIKSDHDLKRLQLLLKQDSVARPVQDPRTNPFASPSIIPNDLAIPREVAPLSTHYSDEELLPKIKKSLPDLDLKNENSYVLGSVSAVYPQQLITTPPLAKVIELKVRPNQMETKSFTIEEFQKSSLSVFRIQKVKRGFILRLVGSVKINSQVDGVLRGRIVNEEKDEQILGGDLFVAIKHADANNDESDLFVPSEQNSSETLNETNEPFSPTESIPTPIVFKNSKEVKSDSKQGAKIVRGSDSYTVANAIIIEKSSEAIAAVLKLPTAEAISVSRGHRNNIVSIPDDTDLKILADSIEEIVRNRKEVYVLKIDDRSLFLDAGVKQAPEVTKAVIDAVQKSQSKPKKNLPAENEEASIPFEMKLPIDVTTGALGSDVFSFYIGIMR